MKVSTVDLKNSIWGTPCGTVGKSKCLSEPLVIDFIDMFFGGELDNVEVEDLLICGGCPTLKKLAITEDELSEVLIKFPFDINIDDVLDDFDADLFSEITEDEHPDLICYLFSNLVGHYGGSFRCDYIGDGEVDLESE